MQMTAMVQSFVFHFGEMGSRWGINRTVGQMYALLVMSQEPLNADDLASALSISRSNVSMGLKELQAWRLVKLQHKPGDRKEYYSAIGDIWEMGKRVLEERRKREIDPTLTMMRDLLLEQANTPEDEYAQQQMRDIHDLLELVTDWSQDMQSLSVDQIKTLMKLGSGVGKVLELGERFLKISKSEPNE